jgi:hypothetical protein
VRLRRLLTNLNSLPAIFSLALFISGAFSPVALAVQLSTQESAAVPCATLHRFAGEVRIMDSSRTHLIDVVKKAGIPCGGWMSITQGWAELHHRDGFRIHVGPQAFVELPENNPDGHYSGDHLILYRGTVFGQAGGGSGELRITTANARARVNRGSILLLFSQQQEETQLTTLENKATLENRFQSARKIVARAGEATSLNLKLMRVIPTSAAVVSIAGLKPRLSELNIEAGDQVEMLKNVKERQERSLASDLTDPAPVRHAEFLPDEVEERKVAHQAKAKKRQASRSPAASHHARAKNYQRHGKTRDDAKLRDGGRANFVSG